MPRNLIGVSGIAIPVIGAGLMPAKDSEGRQSCLSHDDYYSSQICDITHFRSNANSMSVSTQDVESIWQRTPP